MTQQVDVAVEPWGPVPLRLMIGLVFLMHGSQKLFVFEIAGVTGMMTNMGIPFPTVSAVVVTAVELLGGLSLVLGLLSRWAAVALAIDMAVAVFAARLKGGFFAPNGAELELTLLAACLTLTVIGSGALSLDRACLTLTVIGSGALSLDSLLRRQRG